MAAALADPRPPAAAARPPSPADPRLPGPKPARVARPRLRVVPARRHTRHFAALLCVLIAAGIFGVVTLSAMAAEAAFQARELEAEVERLSQRYDELTAEVAALASPERVQEVASTELGMVPAGQPGFLEVEAPAGTSTEEDQPALARPTKPALSLGTPPAAGTAQPGR